MQSLTAMDWFIAGTITSAFVALLLSFGKWYVDDKVDRMKREIVSERNTEMGKFRREMREKYRDR